MRLLFLLGLLLSAVSPAQAQPAVVSGYVKDATTGETLLFATVAVPGTNRGTTTNNAGFYVLNGLEAGTYTLAASYVGYRPFRVEVTLGAGEQKRLDIELQPEAVQFDEVLVEGEQDFEEERAVGIATMPVQTITEIPAAFEADLFRALQFLPGVKAASDFSSGLYIRGGGPDQTLILLDRTTVYNPSHFFGFFSTFNPDAIKDVRLFKGGYPAEYGGRIGAVLDVYNRDGNDQEVHGKASVGLLASRASVEGPIGSGRKGSFMVAARRSTLEPLLAVLQQYEDNVPESFYFYDLNGKLTYNVNPANKVQLAFYGGEDNIAFPFATDARFDLRYGNRTASASWTHLFSQNIFSNLTLTWSRYFNFPKGEIATTTFERDNQVYDVSAKGDVEYVGAGQHDLKAGFWAGNLTLRLVDSFEGNETLGSRLRSAYGSVYLQDTWRPTWRWTVKAGLRANYFGTGDYVRFDPRLSVDYKLRENLLLQAAYGRYHQFLTLITNEVISGFDVWLIADDGVPPAWGDHFVVGLKSRPLEGYNLDVEAFYRTMRQLFELDPFLPDAAGLEYADLFRSGSGFAYGLEVLLQKSRGPFTGFVGYTWGTTRRKFPSSNQGRYYPPKYDRIHDVSAVVSRDLGRSWKLTSAFTYSTGQTYTLPLGRTSVRNPFTGEERDVYVVGKTNARRLPAYHRLDVGFTRSGRFFGVADYELQLQAINVYNRRNVWFYQYDFDDNPVTRSQARMLPILPNVALTLSF